MVLAVFSSKKPVAIQAAEAFKLKAKQSGIDCLALSSLSQLSNSKADYIVTFGGDGTVLYYASVASQLNIPIISFNVGKIGFLTTVDVCDIDKLVNCIINKNFNIIERSMLEISIDNSPKALNEINICSSKIGRAINLQVSINGINVYDFLGDGVIVSTNSGSTAYSLSAGGAIISPDVQANIVTPLSSHLLSVRPIVISPKDVISVAASNSTVIIDGVYVKSDSNVYTINSSSVKCSFVKINDVSFYKKLNDKIF